MSNHEDELTHEELIDMLLRDEAEDAEILELGADPDGTAGD